MQKLLLGRWQPDLSNTAITQLRSKGYTAIFLAMGYFYEKATKYKNQDYGKLQDIAIESMYSCYLKCLELGFEFFVIDCGWGLGIFDGNIFYEKVILKFKNEKNVKFYFGEPIESLYEKGCETIDAQGNKTIRKFTLDEVKQICQNRLIVDERFIFDATKRNFDLLYSWFPGKVTCSSYWFSHTVWQRQMNLPLYWIQTQPSIQALYCYLKFKWIIRENNFDGTEIPVFAYGGNVPAWNGDGWELKLLNIFWNLGTKISNYLEAKFLKVFLGDR